MTSFRLRILAQTLPFLLIAPMALAQMPPGKAPSRGEATAALNQPDNPGAAKYTRQQIDQLVAPIALYPDELLSQVLMAATYPQQVVEAAQWVQDPSHRDLKGDALAQALEPLPWDPSVKALVPFPQILVMMSDHIEWTEALGVAFATQQAEVMSRVQALRQLAMKSGKLKQVKHLQVRQEGAAIVITSAEPDRVYVPVYNPTVVYGEWPDREAPPVYLPPPQGFAAETIEPGFEISTGYTVVRPLWGWSRPDWRENRITVNRTEYTRITRDVELGPGDSWRHNGPIVLVAPAAVSRTTTVTTTNVPAGTVAPGRATAVVALPQRAAAQPNLIQSQSTTTQTTTRPGQATTTTAQPGTTSSGQTAPAATAQPSTPSTTSTAQPTTAQPSKSSTTGAAHPITAQPGKAGTSTAAQPSAAEPSKSSGTANQPVHAAPTNAGKEHAGKEQAGKEQAGSSHPTVSETEKDRPAAKEQSATVPAKPGRSETSKTETPAEPKAGERHERPGEAAKNQGVTTSPAANAVKEHAPASTMAKPPSEATAPRPSEHAGTKPSGAPPSGASPSGALPAGPTTPGGSAAGHEPPRMKAPEASGQGTSTPPQAQPPQTPPHQAPGPQRPHEAAPKPPGPSPEQGEKKEH